MDYGTEIITLPSGGKLYPADSPLASGEVELRVMTASDENLLTNPNYLRKGSYFVLDKLLQRLAVTPFDPSELLEGDYTALLLGLRVVSYGPQYPFKYYSTVTNQIEEVTCDLTRLPEQGLGFAPDQPGINQFSYRLPFSEKLVTFQLPTRKTSKAIDEEIEAMKKISTEENYSVTTRLKHLITSVDGSTKTADIRQFVDSMPALDSRMLRKRIKQTAPDVLTTFTVQTDRYTEEGVEVPLNLTDLFFPE